MGTSPSSLDTIVVSYGLGYGTGDLKDWFCSPGQYPDTALTTTAGYIGAGTGGSGLYSFIHNSMSSSNCPVYAQFTFEYDPTTRILTNLQVRKWNEGTYNTLSVVVYGLSYIYEGDPVQVDGGANFWQSTVSQQTATCTYDTNSGQCI